MINLRSNFINTLTTVINYGMKKPIHVASFNARIRRYSNSLDRYDRQFHMRPPNL